MPIPSTVLDLGSITSSNSPLGSDSVGSPATVDDFFRSHAAIIKQESLIKSWERRGDAPSYVSASLFSVPGNQSAHYAVGRRVQARQGNTSYGTINSVTYTTATGVYVTMDGGASLSATLSEVRLGVDPNAIPVSAIALSFLPLTGGTMTGPITMSNNSIIGAKVVTTFQEVNAGSSGAAKSLSWSAGQYQYLTVNADTVLTVKNPPGVGFYQLRLVQDGTGGRTVSFVGLSSTRWLASAAQPAFNKTASGETIISLFWNGSAWTQSAQKVGAA
jgi:hypothetical protein